MRGVSIRVNEWDHAESHLDAAEELVEETDTADAKYHLPLILSARAELKLAISQIDEAMSLAERSVNLAIEQEKQVDRAICQRVMAQVLMARDQYQQAADLLEESLPLLDGRQEIEAAKIKALLGQCTLKRGDVSRDDLRRGDELIKEAQSTFERYEAKFELAQLAQLTGVHTEQR